MLLYGLVRFVLSPLYIGFVNAYSLMLFWFVSIVGVLAIYKYPNIAQKSFIISAVGCLAVIFVYMVFGAQVHWSEFHFPLILLLASCFFLLYASYLLQRVK